MLGGKERNEKYRASLASEHKRRIFEEGRKKLMEGRDNNDEELIEQAQNAMMKLFSCKDDYEHALWMYEQYEKDVEEETKRMEEMAEDSITFQQLQNERIIQQRKQEYQRIFAEEWEEEKLMRE